MGLSFPARAICDRCKVEATLAVVVSKLNPAVSMHLDLPVGWTCETKPESQELCLHCPDCVGRHSLLPMVPKAVFQSDEPLTDPAVPRLKKLKPPRP